MKRVLLWILAVFLLILLGLRLALPHILKKEANKRLESLEEYKGHVNRVDLAILRGGFTLEDLEVTHRNNDIALRVPRATLNVHWMQLFRGLVVVSMAVDHPRLSVLASKPMKAAEKVTQKTKEAKDKVEAKTGKSLPDLLAGLVPFRVEQFIVDDGVVHFRTRGDHLDEASKSPGLEGRLTEVDINVSNLTNTKKDSDTLSASLVASARIMDATPAKVALQINPLAKEPHFNFAITVDQLAIKHLNPILDWQWGVRVATGTFSLYAEGVAKDGAFKGYMRPFLIGMEVAKKPHRGPIQAVKEAVVSVVSKVLENQDSEQVATQVPFEGRFENPQAGIWEAVVELLKNAFIQALRPSFDPEFKA